MPEDHEMTFGLRRQRPGELPAEITELIGRQRELGQVTALLKAARLVTVTGPGGIGKTRVALRVASAVSARFPDGTHLAELSALSEPELLPNTVAWCLGLPEQDARAQLDAVIDYLRDKRLLLILDTCEHLLDSCALFADLLLRGAPGVSVLATSRQPLDVPGEHTFQLAPLEVPGPDEDPPGGEAVELLARRASAVLPGFTLSTENRADVIRLCRRLDGIPLAIELAAVRLRAVPLTQLTDRLDTHFRTLTGTRRGIPRHQTIRSAIQWSHDLCTPAEQTLWARLSVFAGTFGVDAAEQVCPGGSLSAEEILPVLAALVDKSVLLRVDQDGARYRLLDPIREFAAVQLASTAERNAVKDRHLAYYLAMAQRFHEYYIHDQLRQFRGLLAAHDDLRAALEYALSTPGRESDGATLAAMLSAYWAMAGLLREASYWLTRVFACFPGPEPSTERAMALVIRSYVTSFQGDTASARDDAEAGIAMAEELGEERIAAFGYQYLQLALTFAGSLDEAAIAGEQAERLMTAQANVTGLVGLEPQLAYMKLLAGQIEPALEHCERGLAIAAAGSDERLASSYTHTVRAFGLYLSGQLGPAAEAAGLALTMKQEIGDIVGMAYCLEILGMVAAAQQRHGRVAWLIGAADPLWRKAGTPLSTGGTRFAGNEFMTLLQQQSEQAATTALGADSYTRLWRGGARAPLDEVIALAASNADALAGSGPLPLTNREREVASLVSEGLSNREIATRLVLSKRTIDAHIEHIYAKLGISSRVQLTTLLRSNSPPP
jgi:predicted ATPase/DNA-binding CsgD family transcriptional regulator